MQVQYAMALRVFISQSVTCQYSVEMFEQIELAFSRGYCWFILCYGGSEVGYGIQKKNYGTPLWNISSSLDFEKRYGTSTVASVIGFVRPTIVTTCHTERLSLCTS